jgi:two-component system nitrogen regulation sensor histidine kinase NtrY
VAAAVLLATQVLTFILFVWTGDAAAYFIPNGDLLSTGICLALFLVTRAPPISDAAALRVGLATEVLLCASLSGLSTYNAHVLHGHAPSLDPSTLVIVVFPLMVPAPPRLTAWISLLAAAAAPICVLFLTAVATSISISHPIPEALAIATFPVLAAGVAYAIARMRHEAYVDVEELRQEQSLLETLLSQVGAAVILVDAKGRLAYANDTARELLLKENAALGAGLSEALHDRAAAVGHAFAEDRDALITLVVDGEPEVVQVVRRPIEVGFLPHGLLVARRFTSALRAREIAAYKRVVRVLVHELKNALGPIASVLSSTQRVLGDPQHAPRLQSVFGVVRERVKNLGDFLERYASLARLPAPRPTRVAWGDFLAELGGLHAFRLEGEPPPGGAHFDAAQIQQVISNLLKNADEAGSPPGETEIALSVEGSEVCICVSDRGSGLSDEAWRNAMTPLFSTKPKGSGLGLALCREILEAHGGRLGLFPRPGGGTTVRCWLPTKGVP